VTTDMKRECNPMKDGLVCKTCLGTYTGRANSKYCPACKEQASKPKGKIRRAKRAPKYEKRCQFCGKLFRSNNKNSTTCAARSCRAEYQAEHRAAERERQRKAKQAERDSWKERSDQSADTTPVVSVARLMRQSGPKLERSLTALLRGQIDGSP